MAVNQFERHATEVTLGERTFFARLHAAAVDEHDIARLQRPYDGRHGRRSDECVKRSRRMPEKLLLGPIGAGIRNSSSPALHEEEARRAGCAVVDGGHMNVGQAAIAYKLLTGIEAHAQRMEEHFRRLVNA